MIKKIVSKFKILIIYVLKTHNPVNPEHYLDAGYAISYPTEEEILQLLIKYDQETFAIITPENEVVIWVISEEKRRRIRNLSNNEFYSKI